MILTALSEWNATGGIPVTVSPAPRADSAPREHTASFLQLDHLRAATANQAAGQPYRAFIGGLTRIDQPLDRDALAAAVTGFSATHENTRTFFEERDGSYTRLVHPPEGIATTLRDGDAVASADAARHITEHLAAQCVPWSAPGCAFGAIDHGGSFTLYYGADHALTDGISHGLALSELAQRYLAHAADAAFTFPTELAQPHTAYTLRETEAAHRFATDPDLQQRWSGIFALGDWRIPRFPLDLGLAPGETAPVRIVTHHLLDDAGATAFEQACASHGARPSGAIFAVLALAEHQLTGSTTSFGLTVLSTRAPEHALSQGWFCNFVPVAFPLPADPTFAALLPRAQDSFNTAKDLAPTPVHAVLARFIAEGRLAPPTSTPQMVNYLDTRRMPGARTEAHRNGLIFTGEGRTSNANMWLVRTEDGLFLSSQTPSAPRAQEVLAGYFDSVREIMGSIARTGDYHASVQ
ncbi:condensation domain-containing protein [Lolliginicoccus suaedae]|uniref:condensation domain-containing protein n=1 Tax=Lolliginicoccus suaedae TaxID=2605429 RepID=UPI001659B2DD|nr:condensation domain-containing protein [Lolliginicoccus suaedae]